MEPYRVIIAVGGTGGHLYPAMALAKKLIEQKNISVLFVGANLSRNPYFKKEHFPHREVASSTVTPRRPHGLPNQFWQITKGVVQSRKIIREFKPDLIVGFGSYYSLPILMAAKLTATPYILHEQNSIPGRVNRLFSKGALFTGVYFPSSQSLISGKSRQVTMPLRDGFHEAQISKEEARKKYGLDPERPVVLVFGGSQGAKAINLAFLSGAQRNFQVLHMTGDPEMVERLQKIYRSGATVLSYEDQMAGAWRAADFVVSRAGAGTIAEMMATEVPGILIPYPHATDNHQEKNADFMQYCVGGAFTLKQENLDSINIIEEINQIIGSDKSKKMAENIRKYKAKKKCEDFTQVVCDTLMKGIRN